MTCRLLMTLVAGWLAIAGAIADGAEPGLVWQIDGDSNRVYLVGSIHMLRESDYPLPESLERAYDDAEGLVMELDMDDLDEAALAASLFSMGRAANGQTLQSLVGERRFALASEAAAALGIDLARLMAVEPWFAAMTIEQMVMMQAGFEPQFGLEAYFTRRAGADRKPIVGLELAVDQLAMLDSLDADVQAQMLLLSLDEAAQFSSSLDALVASWRGGNTDDLQREFIEPMREYPAIYEALLVARNADWVPAIEGLLDDIDDAMVIVGSAHLIGEHSVVELLTRRGHTVTRLR